MWPTYNIPISYVIIAKYYVVLEHLLCWADASNQVQTFLGCSAQKAQFVIAFFSIMLTFCLLGHYRVAVHFQDCEALKHKTLQ
jgi:hypothetical protein